MANIILTIIDSKHGVVNTSYAFSDEDVQKIYSAYMHNMTPDNISKYEDAVTISAQNVVDKVYDDLLGRVVSFVHDETIRMAVKEMNIAPIQALQKL